MSSRDPDDDSSFSDDGDYDSQQDASRSQYDQDGSYYSDEGDQEDASYSQGSYSQGSYSQGSYEDEHREEDQGSYCSDNEPPEEEDGDYSQSYKGSEGEEETESQAPSLQSEDEGSEQSPSPEEDYSGSGEGDEYSGSYGSEEQDAPHPATTPTTAAFDATSDEGFGQTGFEDFGSDDFGGFDNENHNNSKGADGFGDGNFGSFEFDSKIDGGGGDAAFDDSAAAFGDAFGFSDQTKDQDNGDGFASVDFGSSDFNDSGFSDAFDDDAFATAKKDPNDNIHEPSQNDNQSASDYSDDDHSYSDSEGSNDSRSNGQFASEAKGDLSNRDGSFSGRGSSEQKEDFSSSRDASQSCQSGDDRSDSKSDFSHHDLSNRDEEASDSRSSEEHENDSLDRSEKDLSNSDSDRSEYQNDFLEDEGSEFNSSYSGSDRLDSQADDPADDDSDSQSSHSRQAMSEHEQDPSRIGSDGALSNRHGGECVNDPSNRDPSFSDSDRSERKGDSGEFGGDESATSEDIPEKGKDRFDTHNSNSDLENEDFSERESDSSRHDTLNDEGSFSGSGSYGHANNDMERDNSTRSDDFSGSSHSRREDEYSEGDAFYSEDEFSGQKENVLAAGRDSVSDRDRSYSGVDNSDRDEAVFGGQEDASLPDASVGDEEYSGEEGSDHRDDVSGKDDSHSDYSGHDSGDDDDGDEQDSAFHGSAFKDKASFGFANKEPPFETEGSQTSVSGNALEAAFDQNVDFEFGTQSSFQDAPVKKDEDEKNGTAAKFVDSAFGFDDKGWDNADGAAKDSFDSFGFQGTSFDENVPLQEESDDFGFGASSSFPVDDAEFLPSESALSRTSNTSNQEFSSSSPSTKKKKGERVALDSVSDGDIEYEDTQTDEFSRGAFTDFDDQEYTSSPNNKQAFLSKDSHSDGYGDERMDLQDEDASYDSENEHSQSEASGDSDDSDYETQDDNKGHRTDGSITLADTIDSAAVPGTLYERSTLEPEQETDHRGHHSFQGSDLGENDRDDEKSDGISKNLPPGEQSLRDKLASRPGRTTNFNRYTREQMLKLSAQNATDAKKKNPKQKNKAEELVELVTNVTEVMIYLDELIESGETDPDSDSHLLLHGFECLVGIFLQLSDEMDVMSTFAKTADKVAMDALKSLLKFALPLNDIFADLRPVVEHYFTHDTDEEMNDLIYGMNLMVELLCELSDKVGERQEWNERACTAYATLVELLSRDALEVISIYDDVDTPAYELSLEIEEAWNATGHIEEFQTLEEAADLAVFRQICYEVLLSTDKWCPDTETLMNICGIEEVMLDEASEEEEVDESELAIIPETAVQVLDKINGPPLRRPALLASVLRRVLPGQKISDKSLAAHLTSIRSAMRSPLGLPASNLIGISSIPEIASDPTALGVAGIGKTTLAALIANHKDIRRHFVGGIAWIHLGQKELNYSRYIQCLRDLISQLEIREEEEPAFPELLRTPGETVSQRRRREEGFLVFVRETMIAFLKKRPVLIVLDDVCFESDLDWFDFGAPSDDPGDAVSSCVTLVTTRRRNLLPAADMVEVDMLDEDEAATLLVRESGDLSKTITAKSKETRSVVRECANHALAVKSVGRWLNLKHTTSGEEADPEKFHTEVVESMQRIIKHGPDDDADMMYEILNMSLSPSINGEPTSIIKFCFAAFVHVFCDKEFISDFALADATPIVPLGTVEMLFEAILGLEEETLLKEGSLFYAQKKDAAKLIPTALASLGIFKVITTVAGAEEETKSTDAVEEKYLQIMHVVQQEYGEYLLDQDLSLRDLGMDAEQRWNKALAKAYLATKPQWDSDTPDASLDYFLEMMPVHLIRGEMLKEASSLLSNAAFVKGRLFALGRENGTRRHIKDCETLFDILMKKKASARKKYDPKGTLRNAYKALGDHLNMDEDEFIKEEGSPEAVEVGRCQFEIGFSLADKRLWELAIEHWEAAQEILVSALGMVEVVAGILYNIGVVYAEMSEYEQALGSLKQCLRVRGTIHGEDHILYAQTIQRIGDVFFTMSDYHEAMESYNWALDVMHIEPSHHRIDIGDILETMGKIHFYKGESDDALQCYQDALQSKQTELGEDHPELSSIYDHMGNVLSEQGKTEDAIAHLVEAIRLKNLDMYGGDERDAEVMTMQGVLHVRQGKRKIALDYYERALQILVTKAPHRKEHIASLLHYIACVYLVGGENKKAMKLFEESLQARRKVLGFVHLDVASTLFSMAYLHQKRNRLDKALKCLEEALKIRQLRLPDSEKVAVTHEKIGTIARSIGKLKKAENAFSEALRIRKLIHGDSHPAVAKVMQDLGDLMDDRGEYEEAMKNYREAYRIRKSFGGDTLPVAETLYTIGFTYSNSGHYEKALECLDAALKIQRLHNGEDSPECGDTLNMIGYLKAKIGEVDEAQEFLRDALRIRKLQGDRIKISETLKNIGNAHRSKQEYRSAMESYQECLNIRQRELGRENDKVADALVAIGNILADLSRPKEAMEAYQEALGIRARLFGDLDSSLAPILQAMGMLDFQGKNYDRSLQLLNDYISIRSGNKAARDSEYVNVLFTVGNIYQLRHDDEQAKKAWTEAYETFKDLGLADSNPEHAEQVEKLMRDHGLGHVVEVSNQDDFPDEPMRKKGAGMLKLLKQKVKRGDGQNGMRRRKERGQRL